MSIFKSVPPSSEITVLVVDDDPVVLRALTRDLADQDYGVEPCAGATTAVERVKAGGIGAVVSDISMPEMTGMELLRKIREHDPDLPVVLITGIPAVESATQAIEYGAFKYVVKPIDARLLKETVAQAIQLYRLARMKRQALTLLGVPSAPTDLANLEAIFQNALSSSFLAFQPIINAADGSVFGYEALLRCRNSALADPIAIVSAAERLGELKPLGQRIRDLAATAMQQAPADTAIFVNLHPSDLLDADLGDPASLLSRIANRVVLEVTERASLSNVDGVRHKINQLRELGFRIAVDDLGAGYAGLSSFALLEPEIVKLDMALVRAVDRDPTKQKLVASMTKLCKDMGLSIVAEGVETTAECDTLIELGCDLLQGYLFAHPGDAFPSPSWK